MQFEWDNDKAARNVEDHQVPFEYATRVFLDPKRLDAQDERRDYAEVRRITLGEIEGRVFVVVYTHRGEIIRVISARKANRRGVRKHETLSTRFE